MSKAINIIRALDDPGLLRPALGKSVESWRAWRTFHKTVHGLPLDEPGEADLYRKCTSRPRALTTKPDEVFAICGRRSGKSFCIALEAVFACLIDDFWQPFLAVGEKAYFIIIATDKLQCRIIMNYIKGLIQGNKLFRSQVEVETQEEVSFRNNSVISIRAANFRSIRGPAFLGAALDELAFWRDENAANPASEIVGAILPAMIPGSTLFGISSAYAKQGLLYDEWREHFGQQSETLIWVTDTKTMNPLFDQKKIDKAMRKDSSVARAEYFSIFRDDLEGVFTRAAIENAIVPGRQELPPALGVHYKAFCDPSGGRHDSFTLSIAHGEGIRTVIDLADEVKVPFSPAVVVGRFAETLKQYGIRQVTGDKYAGSWPSDEFEKHGIKYIPAELTASELYLELVPRLSNGTVELPENDRLQAQFLSLLRRTGPGGKDSVITPQGSDSHADLSNAVAGAVYITSGVKSAGGFLAFSEQNFYGSESENWNSNHNRLLSELNDF